MNNTDETYRLAERYMKEGRFPEAIDLYETLIDLHPEEDSLRLKLAWAYKDSGRQDDAVTVFEALLEKELKRKVFTGFAFDELVKIFKEEKQYDRMIGICERAVAAQPDDVSLLFTLGDAYLLNGHPEKAIEVFKNIIVMEPDASASHLSLGNAHIATGDYESAEAAYESAVTIDPPDADVYYNRLGMTYLRAGEYARAGAAFEKAIERRGDEPLYHCNRGDVLVMVGRLEEASASYEKAAGLNPESRGAYLNRLGNTLYREKQYLQAIDTFKRAVAAEPRNPFYHLHLARSYEAAGFPEEAARAGEKAQSLK
jgi:tetratricopeptide (TPR) repeat protein